MYKLNFKQHLSILISSSLILLPIEVQALPSGQQVVSGSATFDTSGERMNITTSNKVIINYNSFNIGSNEVVNFIQPGANSVVLNRVVVANPSSILGTLNANGKVFLVNPAGIYFGANSVVNANSFLATTLNISDKDFLNNRYSFEQMKNSAKSYIIQKGTIHVSPEGFIVLASPFVSSEGALIAKSGHITVGATDNFYIEFDTNGLVKYDYATSSEQQDAVVVPKSYADAIIENVINTETLQEGVKIVQDGESVRLVGADGTAMVSSTMDTDAQKESGNGGSIDVKAQNQAFMLNNTNLHSNAQQNGNGGIINVYADKLSYTAKGASYSVDGGSKEGDGGYLEISAKNSVVLDGSKVSLRSNGGKKGLFVVDPGDLKIQENQFSGGGDLSFVADKITVFEDIIISTRDLGSNSDHWIDPSAGSSGDLLLDAPTITLQPGSKLLTFGTNGHASGEIKLNAVSNTKDAGTQASSAITINGAVIKGGKVTLSATASSQDHFDSTDDEHPMDPKEHVLDFLEDIPTSPVGLSIASSKATIDIENGSKIEGSSLDIKSSANSQGSVLTIFKAVGIGYGSSEATAKTTIKSGATLQSSGDITIGSDASSSNKVSVYTANLGNGRGSKANLSLAYAHTDTTSETVVEDGATIDTSGALKLEAHTAKAINASASAAAYEDGTVGAGVAIGTSSSTTRAKLGGNIDANELSVTATTDNDLLQTSASAGAGSGFVGKRLVSGANNLIDKVQNYTNTKVPTPSEKSGSRSAALSAAFAYSKHSSTTESGILGSANINVDKTADIKAHNNYTIDTEHGAKGLKTSAIATIDTNDDAQKTYSVAGAVAVSDIQNSATAFINDGAALNAKGDINVESKTYMPYEITWHKLHSVTDIMNYANSNGGIQKGFFTTWAQSNSQGEKVGVAGAVNYLHIHNDTESYVAQNAKINEDKSEYGNINISAITDMENLNLAGVFGVKFFGTSGDDKGSVGGSYLDVSYDDTTKVDIKNGSYLKGKNITLSADSKTKNISVAEAGGKSDKYGASGSFSLLKINNTTKTTVDGATIVATDTSEDKKTLQVSADDFGELFNITGGIMRSKNAGIGASISINDITRDTEANLYNTTFENDGDMLVRASNRGEIYAYSLAGSIATSLGVAYLKDSMSGQFGIGLSGDVSLNSINDTTLASITNSNNDGNEQERYNIDLQSSEDTTIKAFAGSVSFAVSNKLSVGLAGSYSHNTITTNTKSSIANSNIYANKLQLESTNSSDLFTLTAGGSGAISGQSSVGIAGSVSMVDISNEVYSEIIDTSFITTSADTILQAEDSTDITTIAGSASAGGKAGIGASISLNNINNKVNADFINSTLNSEGSYKSSAVENGTVDSYAATLAVGGSGFAAAISALVNNVSNEIKSWINSAQKDLSVASKVDIEATDNEEIDAIAGEVSVSEGAGVGISAIYNTIKNTLKAYIYNSNVDAGDNVNIHATSDKSIDAKAAGGSVSGSVSAAGAVVINNIEDSVKSYISKSDISTQNSLSLLAYDKNDIVGFGGILSAGKTAGIGGSVATNIIKNEIEAYIKDGSNVKAKAKADMTTLLADDSGEDEQVRGIDILAYGNEAIHSSVANLSGGGSAGVGASVSVNLLKDNINSYIQYSHINNDNADADNLQSLRVRAASVSDISAFAGDVSGGAAAGVGASSDTSMIKNSTNAYIKGGFIYAKNLAQTTSNSIDRVNATVISGEFGGAAALAGSVSVINVLNENHAYTLNTNINSEGDLDISASDTTVLGTTKDGSQNGILVGGLSIGGSVGLGGSVAVTKVRHNVTAHADDSVLNAKKTTSISADSSSDFLVYVATSDIGLYAGAGGAVAVNTADNTVKAYTSSSGEDKMLINQDEAYKNESQDVIISAGSDTYINSSPGAVGGGAVGASGSIDVDTIHTTTLAEVGADSKVNAGGDLKVSSSANKRVYSNAVAGAGGIIGVTGAVSVVNINTNIDSESLSSSENTKDSTNDILLSSRVGDQLGTSQTAEDTKNELDSETTTDVNSEFDSKASPAETTYARIGDNAQVRVDGATEVTTNDSSWVHSLTGITAAGALGVGGSVSIVNIGDDTRAYVGNGADIRSGSLLLNSNVIMDNLHVESFAAAAGLVGLGAAVSKLHINYENDAFSGANALLSTTSGDLTIEADTTLSSNNVEAEGAAAGAGAAGAVEADLVQKGNTEVLAGEGSTLNSAANIHLTASHSATELNAFSKAAAGGLISGTGSWSYIEAEPVVIASYGSNVKSTSVKDTNIEARTAASLKSRAEGVNVGAVNVGASLADAIWRPTTVSSVGSNAHINTDTFNMRVYENMNENGNSEVDNIVNAEATSAVGSELVGLTGSLATAKRDSKVRFIIYDTADIDAKGKITLNAKGYGKTTANTRGNVYSEVLAAGTTEAKALNNVNIDGFIYHNSSLHAASDISINLFSRAHSSSDSFGGAGGLLGIAGTQSTANVDKNNLFLYIGDKAALTSDNGDIRLNAEGYTTANAVSNIETDGAVTKNESESDVTLNHNIEIVVGKSAHMDANNIVINAYNRYLSAVSKATSVTTAANSKSKAYANTDVTSNTNIRTEDGSSLHGIYSVTLKSAQDESDFLTNAEAFGKIKAGFTGELYATAHNNVDAHSDAAIESGSSFTTNNLKLETKAPKQNENTYKINASAESNTVVTWVLTTVDELVEEVSSIPFIGWITKWVWHKVNKWVKQVTNSETKSVTSGDFTGGSLLSMNGDIHQKTSTPQLLNIAADGTLLSVGSITATVDGNNIVVNDLINHDQGKITFVSNGDVRGSGNIYLDNKYTDVTINNLSDKNLEINNINVVSDNAAEPNIEIHYGNSNTFTSNFYAESPQHTLHINNRGSGDILFNGIIDNYAGDTTIYNEGGNIFSRNGALLKASSFDINAYRGYIGNSVNNLELELQKDISHSVVKTNSFYNTYLGLQAAELKSQPEAESYMVDGIDIQNLRADGVMNLALHQARIYTKDAHDGTLKAHMTNSQYNIENINASGDVNIDAQEGVSLKVDGTVASGMKDQTITIESVIDPNSRDARYIAFENADRVILRNITHEGGNVRVNLKDGTISGEGSIDTVSKNSHIKIENLSTRDMELADISPLSNSQSGFYINGVKQEQNSASLRLRELGYDKGELIVESKNGGSITLGGDITNREGATYLTSNNGIYNRADNLIDSKNIVLDTSLGGTLGTASNPLYVQGAVDAKSTEDVNLHAEGSLLVDNIQAKDVYINSESTIYAESANSNIEAQSVALKAKGDIGAEGDGFLKLTADTIAANTQEGSIKLNNTKDTTIGTIRDIAGLDAANNIAFVSDGAFVQNKGVALNAQAGELSVKAAKDIAIDSAVAANRVTLNSKNGAISEDGDSEVDIRAHETLLLAANGIGSDNEIEMNTDILDAKNTTTNDIALNNRGALRIDDLDGDGYALYNGGGAIRIYSGGTFTQAQSTKAYTKGALELSSQGTMFISNLISEDGVNLHSYNGDILGDSSRFPNITLQNHLQLYADHGVIGTLANPIFVESRSGDVTIEAGDSKNYLSTYIIGIHGPMNNYLDNGFRVLNNRIVSGKMIEDYYGILFNAADAIPVVDMKEGNMEDNSQDEKLISMNGI